MENQWTVKGESFRVIGEPKECFAESMESRRVKGESSKVNGESKESQGESLKANGKSNESLLEPMKMGSQRRMFESQCRVKCDEVIGESMESQRRVF